MLGAQNKVNLILWKPSLRCVSHWFEAHFVRPWASSALVLFGPGGSQTTLMSPKHCGGLGLPPCSVLESSVFIHLNLHISAGDPSNPDAKTLQSNLVQRVDWCCTAALVTDGVSSLLGINSNRDSGSQLFQRRWGSLKNSSYYFPQKKHLMGTVFKCQDPLEELFMCPNLLTNSRGAAWSTIPVPLKDGIVFLKYTNPPPFPATWRANVMGQLLVLTVSLMGKLFWWKMGYKHGLFLASQPHYPDTKNRAGLHSRPRMESRVLCPKPDNMD